MCIIAGRRRWSVGVRARRFVALGRHRQLGRGMRSTRRARSLRQSICLLGLDQTNHQQILVDPDFANDFFSFLSLLFIYFKSIILLFLYTYAPPPLIRHPIVSIIRNRIRTVDKDGIQFLKMFENT